MVLLTNIKRKKGLMPGDIVQLSQVIERIWITIEQYIDLKNFEKNKSLLGELADALTAILSTQVMKARTNVKFLESHRFFKIDD